MVEHLPGNHFKNKLRVRVMGLLVEDDALLLIRHKELGPRKTFWMPPGGGVNFRESCEDALIREFMEETGLHVEVGEFRFVNEFRNDELHAVELFFTVFRKSGKLMKGIDPEEKDQIIEEVKFLKWKEIDALSKDLKHNAFQFVNESVGIMQLSGFFKFANIW